jgi:hypothetical protein
MSRLPKMMIGFVVRRCAVELGRVPSAAEFAAWANDCGEEPGERYCLFGRPISEREAAVILKHQSRLVTARNTAPEEERVEETEPSAAASSGDNVVSLADVRARLAAARSQATRKRG